LVVGGLVLSASPASATYPGRNGRIAFSDFMTGQIYAVNPDGTGLAQLTHTDANHAAITPEWTADGRLTFSLIRTNSADDHARIWIMNADGSGQRKLAGDAPGFRDYDATITSDGGKVVFARCKPDNGVCAIWIMRSDGTNKRPLTPFREGQNEAIDFFPAVSPDGRHIAFARFAWNGIAAQVYEMSISGDDVHAVTPPRLEAASPDYSPDGRLLTVSSQAPRLGSNVYSVHTDGSHLTRLTSPAYPNNDFGSVFSPRGDRIAFATDRRYDDFCCHDLFAMAADGTAEHHVRTDAIRGVVEVAWGSAPRVTYPRTVTSPEIVATQGAAQRLRAWCDSRVPFMLAGSCEQVFDRHGWSPSDAGSAVSP
jgi:dipeptidyl aminopeptidase/acylaminoacyl peptidase